MEQQACVSTSITLVVRKNWAYPASASRSVLQEGGREYDEIRVDFKSFKILENLNYSMFCLNNGGAVLL